MTIEKRHPLLGRGLKMSSTDPVNGSVLIYNLSTGTWVPSTPPTITGSRGGNAALASLLTALASLGLIVNSTSA
jgi:hypothetical protein